MITRPSQILAEFKLTSLGDVPLHRVKFNAKMEYEYLDNFKVLQKAFTSHRIDKVRPFPIVLSSSDSADDDSLYPLTGSSSELLRLWCFRN